MSSSGSFALRELRRLPDGAGLPRRDAGGFGLGCELTGASRFESAAERSGLEVVRCAALFDRSPLTGCAPAIESPDDVDRLPRSPDADPPDADPPGDTCFGAGSLVDAPPALLATEMISRQAGQRTLLPATLSGIRRFL